MRATQRRTSRKERRDPRRNQLVTRNSAGITAKAVRASRQSSHNMTAMMPSSVNTSPNTVTTPEVNSSLTASTSLVTRVMSRPTGLRSKKPTCSRCRCAKMRAAHVLHHALPGELQDVDLREAHREGQQQREQVECGHPRQPRRVAPRDVLVDGHLGEVGRHQVQGGHDHDEQEGGRHRPPVAGAGRRAGAAAACGRSCGRWGRRPRRRPRAHAVRSTSSSRSWRRCRSA